MQLTEEHIESIEQGYFAALEWLTWNCPDFCEIIGVPNNEGFEISDSVNECVCHIVKQFTENTPIHLLFEYAQAMQPKESQYDENLHQGFNSLGHDLYLTSHGHGAGFWDKGLGLLGDELTKHAEKMPEINTWYESGKIYAE